MAAGSRVPAPSPTFECLYILKPYSDTISSILAAADSALLPRTTSRSKLREMDGTQGMECDHAPTPDASSQSVGNAPLESPVNSPSVNSPMDSTYESDDEYENATRNEDGGMCVGSYLFDPEATRKQLVNMIIMHEYPISIVEHDGFLELSRNVQPLFRVPSRKEIRSDIMETYATEKSKSMNILRKSSSRIAITMDMWTAPDQYKKYMAITAHFIDNNWNLQNLIMRFVYVPYPHTSKFLSKALLKCIFDWNIEGKLYALTVDNDSINDGIVDTVVSKLNPSNLLLQGKLTKMHCCAHILNLIVKDGLNAIGDGLERIRDSVGFWTSTPTRLQTFRKTAKLLGIEYSKHLELDYMTQWNSTYLMLSIALGYKDVFNHLQQQLQQEQECLSTCVPHEDDWVLVEDICKILHLFYSGLNAFVGGKCPASNVLFPLMCEIKYALGTWITSSSLVIKTVGESMLEKFDKYWEAVHEVMAVATVFDPRYKLKFVEYSFSKFYGELADDKIQRVKKCCYDLFHEYESLSFEISKVNEVGEYRFHDGFGSYLNSSGRMGPKSELDCYLEDNVWSRTDNFDVLTWWKVVGQNYPILQKIAKDILTIQISTVTSKSAFNTCGRVVSPYRSVLHPSTLEALMCAKNWLWKDVIDGRRKEEEQNFTVDDEFFDSEEELKRIEAEESDE